MITKEILEDLYTKQNLGAEAVSKQLGVCKTTILRRLRKFQIPLKPRAGYKRFFHNEEFFDNWSHEMAYITGFIAADGHIWKNRPILEIGIHPKDISILEFIRDNVSPTTPITYRDPECVRFLITSIPITQALSKYNITNTKTYNMKIDFDIPDDYFWDYFRGFMDGDGYATYNQYGPRIQLDGASEQFLLDIKKLTGNRGSRVTRPPNHCFRISFGKKDSIFMREKMYTNCCFGLERKKNKLYGIT